MTSTALPPQSEYNFRASTLFISISKLINDCICRTLRTDRMGKIVINLVLALLLLNILYIISSLPGHQPNTNACVAAIAFLHIFLLASFMWFLVEAVNMYQTLVVVFISYESHFLLKRCLIAWGEHITITNTICMHPNMKQIHILALMYLTSGF